jgi:hypothetical protein
LRARLVAALAALGSALCASPANAQGAGIVGSWRGTSSCVDKEHFPACNDEHVIYDVRASQGTRDTVTLSADKLVNGVREFMGEFTFALAADSSWVAEFQTPRYHGRIVLHIIGNHMAGTLADVSSGRTVRALALDRLP